MRSQFGVELLIALAANNSIWVPFLFTIDSIVYGTCSRAYIWAFPLVRANHFCVALESCSSHPLLSSSTSAPFCYVDTTCATDSNLNALFDMDGALLCAHRCHSIEFEFDARFSKCMCVCVRWDRWMAHEHRQQRQGSHCIRMDRWANMCG